MKIKHLLILIILLLPSVVSLMHSGYFGASDDMHIGWLDQMHRTVESGKVPPRFVPDLSFGYGYPLFNFVYPLPFYLGETFHQIFSLVDSTKLVFLTSLVTSGISMYLFSRYYASRSISILSSLVYVYAPYRSTDIYVRGAIGEAFAFTFLPLILLSLIRSNSSRWLSFGGLSLAGLILSHNITAYMFVPFMTLFALINRVSIKRFTNMVALGLLVSVYFWLPAIKDSSLLKYDTVFNFVDHFPTLRQLITPYWGYGASVAGPYDGMSFFIGLANLIVILIAPLYFFQTPSKRLFIWAYITLAVSVFMMNFRSSIFWQNLPLVPYFQFPWRFLTMTTLASASLVPLIKIPPKYIPLIIIPILLVSAPIFIPHDFLDRYDSYYVNRYIPYPSASEEYLLTQEEYLRLPIVTQMRPTSVPDRLSYSPYISSVNYINSLDTSFVSQSPVAYVANYNKYLFPGWTARIDGQVVPLKAAAPYGQISIPVPAGTHSVYVAFQETRFNLILDLLSLAAFVFCMKLIFYEKK